MSKADRIRRRHEEVNDRYRMCIGQMTEREFFRKWYPDEIEKAHYTPFEWLREKSGEIIAGFSLFGAVLLLQILFG